MSSSKRVLMIGGSGRTGKLVIDELLQRNHEVTALVRNSVSVESQVKAGLKTIVGTPMNIQDVRKAFSHSKPDVIIVTLSAPRAGDSPFAANISPPRLMADSTANVVAVMKEAINSPKIVIMQAFGVGESWTNMHCVLRLLMSKSNMKFQYDDHNLVAKETKASGEDYVFVRPARLVEGDAQDVKEWVNDGKGVPMMAAITRGTVAKFLVTVAENRSWDHSAPVITN